MRKQFVLAIIFISLVLIAAVFHINQKSEFSCESQFSIVQTINADKLHIEGFIFLNQMDKNLLINIDGLLTYNDKKYIISRTLEMKYKSYNSSADLYELLSMKVILDKSDNVDDEIANSFLFSDTIDGKIIFIKRVNDDVILFGNHTSPQYGCKRH